MERVKELVQQSNAEFVAAGYKGGIGIAGTVTAASINTWIGICAGVLTCVYMAFQIEAAWRKRKLAIKKQKEYDDGVQN